MGLRLPMSRRKWLVLAGLVLPIVALGLAFGPVVRGQVRAEAARRHLDVDVGAVRPGWFAVRLLDVGVRPHGLDAAQVRVTEVRVRLSIGLHVAAVELHGGDVSLRGDADRLREELRTWRGTVPRASETATPGRSVPITGDSFAVRWFDDGGQSPRAELLGLGFNRDDEGLRLATDQARLQADRTSVELRDGSIELDPAGALLRAHAGAATVEWRPSLPTHAPPSSNGGSGAPPTFPRRPLL